MLAYRAYRAYRGYRIASVGRAQKAGLAECNKYDEDRIGTDGNFTHRTREMR